jgi:hypothetical protein
MACRQLAARAVDGTGFGIIFAVGRSTCVTASERRDDEYSKTEYA